MRKRSHRKVTPLQSSEIKEWFLFFFSINFIVHNVSDNNLSSKGHASTSIGEIIERIKLSWKPLRYSAMMKELLIAQSYRLRSANRNASL